MPVPVVITNRALAVRQTVGFVVLAVVLAVFGVLPLATAAARLSGLGRGLVVASIGGVLVLIAGCGWGIAGSWRLSATIGADGIRVRNLFGSTHLTWGQLAAVDVGSIRGWPVATLIRSDGDRTLRVAVTYGRETVVAQAFADEVRARAPHGVEIGELADLAVVLAPPVATSPIRSGPDRYVVRSWRSGPGSGVVSLLVTLWSVVVLSVAVVLAFAGGAVASVVLVLIGAGLAWLFLRWTRPRLVVTSSGLLTRNGFIRRRVAWSELTAVVAVPRLNTFGTRRRVVLTTMVDAESFDDVQVRALWGTDRAPAQAGPVHQRVMAFAPPTLLRPSPSTVD